jgi:hypothetical protein
LKRNTRCKSSCIIYLLFYLPSLAWQCGQMADIVSTSQN